MSNIKEFLNNNELTVNVGKTTIIEMMVKQKRNKIKGEITQIRTVNDKGEPKIVTPTQSIRVLGGNLQQNLGWDAHLENGELALPPALRKRLGALKHLGKEIPTKCRLTLANGIIMSKVIYLLPLWGGTYLKQLRKIQVLLNKVARWILNVGKRVKTKELMSRCKWLNILELTIYHSIITIWKIIRTGKPGTLRNRITTDGNGNIVNTDSRLQTTSLGLIWRTRDTWNSFPMEVRETQSISIFKKGLKKWILENEIPMYSTRQDYLHRRDGN